MIYDIFFFYFIGFLLLLSISKGSQLNVHDQNIIKTSLDKDGNRIGKSQSIQMGGTIKEDSIINQAKSHGVTDENQNSNENDANNEKNSQCGDCYGAGMPGQCCNTCDDVQDAYHKKGWAIQDLSRFTQVLIKYPCTNKKYCETKNIAQSKY